VSSLQREANRPLRFRDSGVSTQSEVEKGKEDDGAVKKGFDSGANEIGRFIPLIVVGRRGGGGLYGGGK